MTRIKVCGLTNVEDIRFCSAAGVHALGFVVEYPIPVPWNLDRQKAKDLMGRVPPFVSRVIVVGDDPRIVVELTEFLEPHVVQLHGNEPLSVTKNLVDTVKALGVQVVKALRFSVETGKCSSVSDNPLDAARRIEDTGVDALLLDSFSDARPAGTGQSIDRTMAWNIRETVRLPVILAGGLNSANVEQAVAAVNPYGVDVISGVENPVGKKDPDKVRAFMEAVSGSGLKP
ncbi:MAG: N-(5'-phosphoribosyl)anthranilate isomerase [Syntrophorhabdus sp. PtaU1.Bin002]|nr:MAG: N-(5'-phosphoribosyl)anthranilate isomerase [Syntrophorhabdus sp. PtaB.Bin006]OPY65375.1 MAG: N-(5'-phosphoribosyl)anthranilate isomerase [Syntrophorhabdus sp. PtaU1.Bin002]